MHPERPGVWQRREAVAKGPSEGVVGTQFWEQEAVETQDGLRGGEAVSSRKR